MIHMTNAQNPNRPDHHHDCNKGGVNHRARLDLAARSFPHMHEQEQLYDGLKKGKSEDGE